MRDRCGPLTLPSPRRGEGFIRGVLKQLLRAAVVVIAAGLPQSDAAGQETVAIENVPGRNIDADWHRYLNERYGVGIDIPAKGFLYELSDNDDGLTLSSADGEKSISIYGSQDIGLYEAPGDPVANFARLAEEQIDALRLGAIHIVEDRIEPQWFEVTTGDAEYLYYQKGLLSLDCPTFTTNLWIKYPMGAAEELDSVHRRMSASLRGTCPTIDPMLAPDSAK